jgi:hypothetical protein
MSTHGGFSFRGWCTEQAAAHSLCAHRSRGPGVFCTSFFREHFASGNHGTSAQSNMMLTFNPSSLDGDIAFSFKPCK